MDTNRRNFMLTSLFGAGWVGLRALATGLPVSYFLNPAKAVADTPPPACNSQKGAAQYLILSIDQNGDPINPNVPSMWDDPGIVHPVPPADGSWDVIPIQLGSQTVNGPRFWGPQTATMPYGLPQWVLNRTCFFHGATETLIHPDLPQVLALMGQTANQEMLPSIAANHLASCLGTVQAAPVSLVGTESPEYVSYQGRVLPNLNATALKDMLTPSSMQPYAPLANLATIRDQTMNQIWARLKSAPTANAAQIAFIDNLAISRQQARSISDSLLSKLGNIASDDASGQIAAAVSLIQMNITPVVVIKIPFGGDNHFDTNLQTEMAQSSQASTVNGMPVLNQGVPAISSLMTQLQAAGIQDQVTFASLNVFGRTIKSLGEVGRNHWADHHVSILIGSAVKGGVVGGVTYNSTKGDYVCQPVVSSTGQASPSGDLQESALLGSFGMTLCAALGMAQSDIAANITSGKVVTGALTG